MIESLQSLRRRAILMLVLATLYWGLSFPVIKSITPEPQASAGRRVMVCDGGRDRAAVPLAVILMLMFRRRTGPFASAKEMKQGPGIGLFAAAGTLFQTDGMQFTDASTSAFLTQFSAILIPTWIAVRSRHNPGALVWMCCALVLVGVGILGHFEWRTLRFGRGEWETLLCSVFFMGQILWIERKEFEGNRPARSRW